MAQPFLHAGQHRHIIPGLHIDHPVRAQARLLETGGEEIRLRDAPEHLSRQTRGNPGRKAGGSRSVHRAIAAARHLVQAAERQAAPRQAAVQIGQAKGQGTTRPSTVTFHGRDLLTQGGDGRSGGPGRQDRKELPRG